MGGRTTVRATFPFASTTNAYGPPSHTRMGCSRQRLGVVGLSWAGRGLSGRRRGAVGGGRMAGRAMPGAVTHTHTPHTPHIVPHICVFVGPSHSLPIALRTLALRDVCGLVERSLPGFFAVTVTVAARRVVHFARDGYRSTACCGFSPTPAATRAHTAHRRSATAVRAAPVVNGLAFCRRGVAACIPVSLRATIRLYLSLFCGPALVRR